MCDNKHKVITSLIDREKEHGLTYYAVLSRVTKLVIMKNIKAPYRSLLGG